jgi:hypothetical protein
LGDFNDRVRQNDHAEVCPLRAGFCSGFQT